jgi:DNA polymerase V
MSESECNQILSQLPVGEVWGVGRKLAPKLVALGYQTVLDLKHAAPNRLKQQHSVLLEKTVQELNGIVCMALDDIPPAKKQILSSRSFGQPVNDYESLAQSITLYMSRAAEKLRKQHAVAGAIMIFIRSSPFKEGAALYSNGMTLALPIPTDDTRQLVSTALAGLKTIFKPNIEYAKAGVMLSEITPSKSMQVDLFSAPAHSEKASKLMAAMDSINQKMGSASIKLASEGFKRPWKMKQNNKSPSYTTHWEELVTVD